jgi:hypothetical protein
MKTSSQEGLQPRTGASMATAVIPEGKAFRPQPLLSSIPQGVALKAVPGAQTPSPRSRRVAAESRSYRLKSAFQGALAPGVGLRRHKDTSRSAQADRRPKAPGGRIHSAHRPTADRRPSRRLKSAFQGAPRRASASADAKDTSPVGAGRPPAEGPWRPNSFGAQADRRPEAFTPIEIGLLRALSRRASAPADAEDTFPVGAGRPSAEGLHAD